MQSQYFFHRKGITGVNFDFLNIIKLCKVNIFSLGKESQESTLIF